MHIRAHSYFLRARTKPAIRRATIVSQGIRSADIESFEFDKGPRIILHASLVDAFLVPDAQGLKNTVCSRRRYEISDVRIFGPARGRNFRILEPPSVAVVSEKRPFQP